MAKEELFNFDLEEMKKAVSEKKISVPKFDNFDDFNDWLDDLDNTSNLKVNEVKNFLDE